MSKKHRRPNADRPQPPTEAPKTTPDHQGNTGAADQPRPNLPSPEGEPEPKAEVVPEAQPDVKIAESEPQEPEEPEAQPEPQEQPAQAPMDPAKVKRLVILTDGKRFDVQLNQLNDIEVRYLGSLLVSFTTR